MPIKKIIILGQSHYQLICDNVVLFIFYCIDIIHSIGCQRQFDERKTNDLTIKS